MSEKIAFESRLRRFSRARRGLLNAALAYLLGILAFGISTDGMLLLSGWRAGEQ